MFVHNQPTTICGSVFTPLWDRAFIVKRWPLIVWRPHAAVSSDASSDSLRTQENAKDKLIIYQHYATDDQWGVTAQTRTSTRSLETGRGNSGCLDAVFLSLFNIFLGLWLKPVFVYFWCIPWTVCRSKTNVQEISWEIWTNTNKQTKGQPDIYLHLD